MFLDINIDFCYSWNNLKTDDPVLSAKDTVFFKTVENLSRAGTLFQLLCCLYQVISKEITFFINNFVRFLMCVNMF